MITWRTFELTGQSDTAMDGGFLVGQVVRYDRPEGWQGFVHGVRIDGGPWQEPAGARSAVEAAWAGRRVGSRRDRTTGGRREGER